VSSQLYKENNMLPRIAAAARLNKKVCLHRFSSSTSSTPPLVVSVELVSDTM
jgi:hypothetical protein